MVKLFVTGDNHIGLQYSNYQEVKEKLIQSRFDSMEDMVNHANDEDCGLFVVTGDLFDRTNKIHGDDVKKVVKILSEFMGEVLVLPGNHDFYTGEEKVWKDFEKVIKEESIHNIIVLNKFVPSTYRVGEDMVVVYPAYCQKRESKENNLGWIKEAEINTEGVYNIGIAHGTIEGIAPDNEKKYFWMSKKELSDIPVDVWLIGHTHVPYPKDLKEDTDIKGDKIYNAGTHEQTDVGNKTDGYGFVITLEKSGSKTTVRAHKYRCGKVKYYEFDIKVKPDSEEALEQALEQAVAGIDTNSIIRTNISGTITQKEYESKAKIYQKILGRFLAYEQPNDSELSEEITIERIRSEFAETSFAAIFLEKFIDNPIELQMAYQLLQECKIN